MKKIVLLGMLFVAFSASAQSETRIGGMLAYGSEIENIGIGANAEFPIMENLTVAPSFIFYLPKDEDVVKMNMWEINANAHYYFISIDNLSFYGLGGLNYSHVKVETDFGSFLGIGDTSSSEGKIGFNLGAGANFDLGKNWLPFAELKYVVSDFDQIVLAAGVRFNL